MLTLEPSISPSPDAGAPNRSGGGHEERCWRDVDATVVFFCRLDGPRMSKRAGDGSWKVLTFETKTSVWPSSARGGYDKPLTPRLWISSETPDLRLPQFSTLPTTLHSLCCIRTRDIRTGTVNFFSTTLPCLPRSRRNDGRRHRSRITRRRKVHDQESRAPSPPTCLAGNQIRKTGKPLNPSAW